MKRVIVAFAAGQVVQLVVHAVALNLWESRQIPFCMAGGFIILFALIAGAWVSTTDAPVKQKTYKDYAEIPVQNGGKK